MAYVIIYMKSINNKHNLVYILIINQYMCAYSSKLNYCIFLKMKKKIESLQLDGHLPWPL